VLSPVSLNSYRAFTAIQNGHGVTKKMDRHLVHRARFFENPALGVRDRLLFRVLPLFKATSAVFLENTLEVDDSVKQLYS
jgi:hypothetical protein